MTFKRFLDYLCVSIAVLAVLAFLSVVFYGNFVMIFLPTPWTGGQVGAVIVTCLIDFVVICQIAGLVMSNLPGSLNRLIEHHQKKTLEKKSKQANKRKSEPTTF